MGNIFASTIPNLVFQAPGGESSLRLESQKITEFSGDMDEWTRWKSRTICALTGSGYEKVLDNPLYAQRHPAKNKIVYAQLHAATVDGTASHVASAHRETNNGYAAWNDLVQWYDGDTVMNETAEALRTKLEQLKLHPGVTASHYMNKFQHYRWELQKLEEMTDNHAKSLFCRNITDPKYLSVVKNMKYNCATLSECIIQLRKEERDLLLEKRSKAVLKQEVKRMVSEMAESGEGDYTYLYEQPAKRARRTTESEQETNKTFRNTVMEGELKLTNKGRLVFTSKAWRKLSEEQQKFVKDYNHCVSHGESTADLALPAGVTGIIGNKARRVPKLPPKPLAEGSKRISFHVDGNNDDDESED